MTRWCIAATVVMRWQQLTDRQGCLLPETIVTAAIQMKPVVLLRVASGATGVASLWAARGPSVI